MIRYSCGSAREFVSGEGSVPTQAMNCQWNGTWTPTHLLDNCDWIACLKPPIPPDWTNLRSEVTPHQLKQTKLKKIPFRVNDWDGKPIAFGDLAHYVCDRGHNFEEDPEQLEVTYSCQDGSDKQFSRGFFNVPQDESDWPRCLRGRIWSFHPLLFFFQLHFVQSHQIFRLRGLLTLSQLCLTKRL